MNFLDTNYFADNKYNSNKLNSMGRAFEYRKQQNLPVGTEWLKPLLGQVENDGSKIRYAVPGYECEFNSVQYKMQNSTNAKRQN